MVLLLPGLISDYAQALPTGGQVMIDLTHDFANDYTISWPTATQYNFTIVSRGTNSVNVSKIIVIDNYFAIFWVFVAKIFQYLNKIPGFQPKVDIFFISIFLKKKQIQSPIEQLSK
jgi:hypothetical protein